LIAYSYQANPAMSPFGPEPSVRAAQSTSALPPRQTSTCSAIARARSTSMPRYRTVLSILVCPRRSCTARRLPVRRQAKVVLVRRRECVPNRCGSNPMSAIQRDRRRAYWQVDLCPARRRPVNGPRPQGILPSQSALHLMAIPHHRPDDRRPEKDASPRRIGRAAFRISCRNVPRASAPRGNAVAITRSWVQCT